MPSSCRNNMRSPCVRKTQFKNLREDMTTWQDNFQKHQKNMLVGFWLDHMQGASLHIMRHAGFGRVGTCWYHISSYSPYGAAWNNWIKSTARLLGNCHCLGLEVSEVSWDNGLGIRGGGIPSSFRWLTCKKKLPLLQSVLQQIQWLEEASAMISKLCKSLPLLLQKSFKLSATLTDSH